jgi:type I restriction enzyme S subunit
METMKDSGVRWIGKIPDSWDLIRTKHFSYMKGRIGWQGLTANEFIEEGPYLVTGTDFENGRVCWERSYHISDKRYEEAPEIQLKVGDLLVTKDGTIGKLAYIDELPGKASLNSHLLVMRPLKNKYTNRFLFWVLSSIVFIEYYTLVSDGSTMDSLSQEKMGNFVFPTPPVWEQESIADYLDTHCGQLDSIIGDLEKQIETLKAYKKSLITEAVTKGLDGSVPMKDSGIVTIGEIPQHWDVKRLKYALAVPLQYGANETGDDFDEENPRYIRITDITEDNKLKEDGKQSLQYKLAKPYLLKDGDVLFARSGATVGKTFYYSSDCGPAAFAGYLIKAATNRSVLNPRFLFYTTLGVGYDNWKNTVFTQATIQNIGADKYAGLPVTLPPVDEQQSIIDYLDVACAKIDDTLEVKITQLKIMEQHKASLIFEYVTGKKRVKEVR